ncbi:MAG: hypothetical protein ACD_2C00061G0009 [uncultured bacterium (gcode 4)]|uniref:HIT domain-containing protein n=1 Tax=uncultured bacterium (gcode 4) TaxID=1234023 RepID=K2GHT3_9BACT|nr:MAG: hypothetical protein ACD_2C00061G0009 [uncultured bacterium (gcode 4)]
MDCIFCKIATWKLDISSNLLYEDDRVIVMLDSDYVIKWHSIVIWKQHFTNLSDLSSPDYAYFSSIVHRAETILLKLCSKNRSINLKSWWIHPHFHFHIYPIDMDSPWRDIHDMIEKDPLHRGKSFFYEYGKSEKEELVSDFRRQMQIISL